jgi:hypothetical protein
MTWNKNLLLNGADAFLHADPMAGTGANDIDEIVEAVWERAVRSVLLAASTGAVNLGFCWRFMSDLRGRL